MTEVSYTFDTFVSLLSLLMPLFIKTYLHFTLSTLQLRNSFRLFVHL